MNQISFKTNDNQSVYLVLNKLTAKQIKNRIDAGDNDFICLSLTDKMLDSKGIRSGCFEEIDGDIITFAFFSGRKLQLDIKKEEWFEYWDELFDERKLIPITLGAQNNIEISIPVKKLSVDQVREKMRNDDHSSFLCESISEFVMDKNGTVDGFWSEISDDTISFKNSDGMFVLNLKDEEWFEYDKFC